MNIHEYQAKAVLREFGVPVPRGIAAFSVDEAGEGRQGARRAGLGREGADPCRRPRQGRRRRRWSSRSSDVEGAKADAPARLHAGHASDRAAGQAGQPPLHRGRLGHRPRVLSLGAGRPRDRRVAFVASTEGGMDIEEVARTTRRRRSSPSPSIRRPASCRIMRHAVAQALRLRPRGRQAGREPCCRSSTRRSSPRT